MRKSRENSKKKINIKEVFSISLEYLFNFIEPHFDKNIFYALRLVNKTCYEKSNKSIFWLGELTDVLRNFKNISFIDIKKFIADLANEEVDRLNYFHLYFGLKKIKKIENIFNDFHFIFDKNTFLFLTNIKNIFSKKLSDFEKHQFLISAICLNNLSLLKEIYFLDKKFIRQESLLFPILPMACVCCQVEIIQFLINDCKVGYEKGFMPRREIFSIWQKEKGENIGEIFYPIHFSAFAGNLPVVRFFINELSISPHSTTVFLSKTNRKSPVRSVLLCAAEGGSVPVVNYLLKKRHADLYEQARFSMKNLFHYAARSGSVELINYLSHGTTSSYFFNKDFCEKTAIHETALFGNVDLFQCLVEKFLFNPYELDGFDFTGKPRATAFDRGIESAELKMIQWIENKFEKTWKEEGLNEFLTLAVSNAILKNKTETLFYLYEKYHFSFNSLVLNRKNFYPTTFDTNVLKEMFLRAGLIVMQFLMEEFAVDLTKNISQSENETLFHVICRGGNLHVISYLIEKYHYNIFFKTKKDETGWQLIVMKHAKTEIETYFASSPWSYSLLMTMARLEKMGYQKIKNTLLKKRTNEGKSARQIMKSIFAMPILEKKDLQKIVGTHPVSDEISFSLSTTTNGE